MYCSGKGSTHESKAGHYDAGRSQLEVLSLRIEVIRMIGVSGTKSLLSCLNLPFDSVILRKPWPRKWSLFKCLVLREMPV